jgi:hypothetical protein
MMNLFFGVFAVAAALLGAILASQALDLGMATFGLSLVGFAVLFVFWLMKDHFDQIERSGR